MFLTTRLSKLVVTNLPLLPPPHTQTKKVSQHQSSTLFYFSKIQYSRSHVKQGRHHQPNLTNTEDNNLHQFSCKPLITLEEVFLSIIMRHLSPILQDLSISKNATLKEFSNVRQQDFENNFKRENKSFRSGFQSRIILEFLINSLLCKLLQLNRFLLE